MINQGQGIGKVGCYLTSPGQEGSSEEGSSGLQKGLWEKRFEKREQQVQRPREGIVLGVFGAAPQNR